MIKCPSPKYFSHLLEEKDLKIVFIGSSGTGKSDISKKIKSLSKKNTKITLDKKKFEVNFETVHIDLLIKDLLFSRIIEDNLENISKYLTNREVNMINPLRKLKSKYFSDSQELDFVNEWMGNILFSKKWYEYSSYWYLYCENESTGAFTYLTSNHTNSIVDTTGSVFSVKKEIKNKLNEKSLIIYIDGRERLEELSKSIAKDKKPIAISNPTHFNNFLEELTTNTKKANNELKEILSYGGKKELILRLTKYKDLETIILKKYERPTTDIRNKYLKKYSNSLYAIFGYYYKKYEMGFRHKYYMEMNPDIIIKTNKLYKMSAKDFFKFVYKKLKFNWRKENLENVRLPSEAPKKIERII